MDLNKAVKMNLKCSDFMKNSHYCNDDTVFLVFDTGYRTHTIYLILNFIYKKYKNLIFRESYLKKIEDYIKMFDNETTVNSRDFSMQLIIECTELEDCLYNYGKTEQCTDIDEYLNEHTSANVIIIDKDSYFKNEYVCYKKE
jgi:hypothetical protein